MKKCVVTILCFLLLVPAVFAREDGISIKIVPNPDSSITEGESCGDINAPIERVWAILLDFDNLTDWMPNCQESYYRGKDQQGRDLAYLVVGMSLFGTRDMLNAYTPLDKGNLKKLNYEKVSGSWDYLKGYTIIRKKGPNKTMILTHAAARTGLPLPNAVNISIMKDQLKQYIVNIRKLVE